MARMVGRRPVMTSVAALVMELRSASAATAHLRPSDTVGDLLDHPAFAGFAKLLLPWDDRPIDRAMRLSDMASLMPYHTHVDPVQAVAALNRLIDDADAGHTVFFDIYSDEQKRTDPDRANTGLFLFRGRPGAPFAVVSPGGGFAYVGSLHEGFPYAVAISAAGDNAFVLRYRPSVGERAATEDLAAALGVIFREASTLGVGTDGYSLWGSSAGARMAANIGSRGTSAFGGPVLPGPAVVIMAHTAHSDRTAQEPPTFAVVGEHDGIAPVATMKRRVDALRQAGTPVEFHVYPGLGHGFGLGAGTQAAGWVSDALRFWAANR